MGGEGEIPNQISQILMESCPTLLEHCEGLKIRNPCWECPGFGHVDVVPHLRGCVGLTLAQRGGDELRSDGTAQNRRATNQRNGGPALLVIDCETGNCRGGKGDGRVLITQSSPGLGQPALFQSEIS